MSKKTRHGRCAMAAATIVVAGLLAGTADAAATKGRVPGVIDVTLDHTGPHGRSARVQHLVGTSSDLAAGGRAATVRSSVGDRAGRVELDLAGYDFTGLTGQVGVLAITDLPHGVIPSSVRATDGKGNAVGTVQAKGRSILVEWRASDLLIDGVDTIVVEYATAGAGSPIIPQPRQGEPLLELTSGELARWATGRVDYDTPLLVSGGLGPVFNKANCGNCHQVPLGGVGSQLVTHFGFADKGEFDELQFAGGPVLQSQTIEIGCEETVPEFANRVIQRVVNGMLGYGLVEAIDDADLAANEDPGAPGVSGRVHWVNLLEDPMEVRAGRFGWKAQLGTVLDFSADAAQNEMGLSNRVLPFDLDPNGVNPPELVDCDDIPDPEDGPDGDGRHFIDRVDDFQRFLAPPPQTPRSGMSGEAVFNTIGCVQCHVRDFTTPDDPALEAALRDRAIKPYGNFLLHDMGIGGDQFPQGNATESEMRTPPLWGVRFRPVVWHDGSIGGTFEDRMLGAIAAHDEFGSEGAASAQAFAALSSVEKDQLVAFLDSLGRNEFDADGNSEIVLADWLDFLACMDGGPYTADDPCAVHDIDQNGTVDMTDFQSFLLAWEGPDDDCNGNGIIDIEDITVGTSMDADMDGVPDECGLCVGDINSSGDVGFADLLELLAAYGPCAGCNADLDGDDEVSFTDLLILLAAWGPCP